MLSFKYKEKAEGKKSGYVLDSLSLKCERPGLYAVVGKNGCGKSTLAKIIMGFYDCNSGRVTFNGNTKEDIGLKKMRCGITYIQKEVFITNDTVLSNIKLANQTASDEAVADICKRINLHGFIEALPEKYNTKLGENGLFLSSGQKQKLSLARAFLRDSHVLLLDEVTSDLDGKAEKEIIALIQELAETRIVLFISHKITSVMGAGRIFLIDSGRLSDEGTHTELMERSALYRELFWLEEMHLCPSTGGL